MIKNLGKTVGCGDHDAWRVKTLKRSAKGRTCLKTITISQVDGGGRSASKFSSSSPSANYLLLARSANGPAAASHTIRINI